MGLGRAQGRSASGEGGGRGDGGTGSRSRAFASAARAHPCRAAHIEEDYSSRASARGSMSSGACPPSHTSRSRSAARRVLLGPRSSCASPACPSVPAPVLCSAHPLLSVNPRRGVVGARVSLVTCPQGHSLCAPRVGATFRMRIGHAPDPDPSPRPRRPRVRARPLVSDRPRHPLAGFCATCVAYTAPGNNRFCVPAPVVLAPSVATRASASAVCTQPLPRARRASIHPRSSGRDRAPPLTEELFRHGRCA
ncbi:hypothetical protein B0H15DRAFT_540616 [Mycena belliarum]|uniref:Uncharacterized protein n=1 Tax=Mycena belliarum TaxID=1033014 RepID=A0AAD6XKS1_9AGAR|nr:hypothetical protein B0H15DRAFT_540616 [Mycena belliae]